MTTLLVTVLLSFVIILFLIAAMGVGAMAGHREIRGSCGRLDDAGCDICRREDREK